MIKNQVQGAVKDALKDIDISKMVSEAIKDSFTMRREALQHHVTYYTTMAGAKAACYALGCSFRESSLYRKVPLFRPLNYYWELRLKI